MGWEPWPRIDDKGLARYVTPEARRLLAIDMSRFDIRGRPEEHLLIVEAIYNALLEKHIHYDWEAYHPAAAKQPIRSPAEILDAPREGTCLDVAALFCGLCLGYELLPLLIVIKGHALAMVSLTHGLRDWNSLDRPEQELFREGPVTEPTELLRLLDEGSYIAIECTGFAYSETLSQRNSAFPESLGRLDGVLSFEQAKLAGGQQLDVQTRPFHFALDMAVAHFLWEVEPYELDTTASVSSLWGIPVPRNPLFTGREDVLKHLYQTLNASKVAALAQPQAISGLGGIGKTQTAIEYAYRHRGDYQVVLWAKADTQETLISDFVTIARQLKLPEKDDRDQNLIVEAVKRWLQNHRDWLLIFDNADDLVMARTFFPPGGRGHILLTTRTQATGGIAQQIEIRELEPEEGALFLLRRAHLLEQEASLDSATLADRTKATEITLALGCLPLALDQAGAFIEEARFDLAHYLDLYQARKDELLQRRGKINADHPESVTTTWSLSFEKVQKNNPAATDLLRFCAFLDPDAIPEEIISPGASEAGMRLKRLASEPIKLDEAIGELLMFSLLRRNPNKTITIHRLIQEVLKARMTQNGQRLWAERAVRAVSKVFPEVEYATRLQSQRSFPHAQVCAALIQQWKMTFPEAVQLLMKAGSYQKENAQYIQAESYYRQALRIREQTLEDKDPRVSTSLVYLADLYTEQGKYAQAEPLLQRAVAIDEYAYSPNHPEVAEDLYSLAALYQEQGKYAQAEPLLQRAVAIDEHAYSPDHPEVAKDLIRLANLYKVQARYTQAEPLLQRAVAIDEHTYSPDHPEVAGDLVSLAALYQEQGKYVQAESLLQRAVAIDEHAYSPDHPEVAKDLVNLANLYKVQARYAQAESYFQRALEIREQAFGREHPEVASSLSLLASLYQEQGKYAQAESYFQQALEIREKTLGLDHIRVAYSLYFLAKLYQAQGRYPEAEAFLQRVRGISEKVFGQEHPEVASDLSQLAEIYFTQGKYKEAEPLYQRALAIREQVFGREHPLVATSLNLLAALYQEQGMYAQAESCYQQALTIYEQKLERTHPKVAPVLEGYASLLRKLGREAEAAEMERRAETIAMTAVTRKKT